MRPPCPCSAAEKSRRPYDACCGPYHRGAERAPTAVALMRARYSAYALGLDDYVFTTWHPRTRPDDVRADGTAWTGLRVLATHAGGVDEETGEVEFIATYEGGRMHEVSRFARRAGRWFYVDGDVD